MSKLSLAKNSQAIRVMNAVAAGTSDQNSSGVNMDNAEAVTFYTAFGTITAGAVTSVKLQQSSDDGSTDDYSDIEGSGVTVADDDDNQVAVNECVRPTKKWVRAVVDRGTQNAVIDGIIAVKTGLRKAPVTTEDTSIIEVNSVVGPAEGTA